MFKQLLLLFSIVTVVSSRLKEFQFCSGMIPFNQSFRSKTVTVPKIHNPLVIHAISQIRISGYFSFDSHQVLVQGEEQTSNLTIAIQVGKVAIFKLSISYAIIEEMPNIEHYLIKLVVKNQVVYLSSKKKFNNSGDLNMAGFVISFTNSSLAKENFVFTEKGGNNYQAWSGSDNFRQADYVVIHLIVIQSTYMQEDLVCRGSYIYGNSFATNTKSPYYLNIDSTLKTVLGIQSIILLNADFTFNNQTNTIYLRSTGTYSFSVLALNTSCEIIYQRHLVSESQNQNTYLTVFLVFVGLSALIICIILVSLIHRCLLKEQKIRVLNPIPESPPLKRQKKPVQQSIEKQTARQIRLKAKRQMI